MVINQLIWASNHGVLINKKIFEKYGYFYEKFIYAGEDTEFYIRLKNNFVKAYYEKEAILYWDTPQTVNEYLKKMRVNSIADWQIFKRRKVWIKIITPIILLILYSILVLLNPCFTLLILPLIACIAVKKRTFNILAILLGIITKYVMVYYYLKNIKYSNSKYHIQKNYEL